jgi:hypothetical protein
MSGARLSRARLRFSFLLPEFGERFGGSRRTLALGDRMDERRRRRLRLGFYYFRFLRRFRRLPLAETPAKLQRNFVVQRAGVCLLVRDSELRQQLEEDIRLYFELASQLIDANFTHRGRPSRTSLRQGFSH